MSALSHAAGDLPITLTGSVTDEHGKRFGLTLTATRLEVGLATKRLRGVGSGLAKIQVAEAAEEATRRERKVSRLLVFAAFAAGVALGLNLSVAHAETIDGDRITILDGDTVALPCDPARGIYPGCGERIRLEGIDAPETGRRARCEAEAVAGLEAKAALGEILRGREVAITRTGVDKYRRTLARLSVAGRSVDEAILATGLAIPYHPGRPAWAARCRHWCPDAPRCEE